MPLKQLKDIQVERPQRPKDAVWHVRRNPGSMRCGLLMVQGRTSTLKEAGLMETCLRCLYSIEVVA